MMKTCCLLFLVFLTSACWAQDTYYGQVVTQLDGRDTARSLYVRNVAGDRLSVYTVRERIVETAAFRLQQTGNGLFLYAGNDSLGIAFQDQAQTVVIKGTDRYVLFPAYYARFKQEVHVKHSVMTLLNLLSDAIGDYPIASILPLVRLRPQLDKRIRQATIVTQRSQADLRDTWTCRYFYQHDRLDSVISRNQEEVRFSKKVRRNTIRTYLSIEDRQVTDRTIHYGTPVTWRQNYAETGQNRETRTKATLTKHDLGMLRKIDLSAAEVLQLLNPLQNHESTKKHLD